MATRQPREYTNRLLALLEVGVLDPRTVITACLNWMSEQDVRDMCESEGFTEDENDDTADDDEA